MEIPEVVNEVVAGTNSGKATLFHYCLSKL